MRIRKRPPRRLRRPGWYATEWRAPEGSTCPWAPEGTEALGADLAGMLRSGRLPGEAAWLKVIAKEGSGWADSAFLERI